MRLFGPWLPDLPAYRSAGLITAKNVLPQTDLSYGPVPSLVEQTPALPARCQGVVSARDAAGNVTLLAGTQTGLYRLDAVEVAVDETWSDGTLWSDGTGWAGFELSDNEWSNISKSGGYSLSDDERWTFLSFGTRVIAGGSLFSDLQSYDTTTVGNFADLGTTLPRGKWLAIISGRLMLGNTWDAVNGNQPRRIWWSARNNPTSFPTPGTLDAIEVESDFQDLEGGGWVQGILPSIGGSDGAIFGESRIWTINDIGPPAFFQIDAKEQGRGVSVPGSLVQVGSVAFYWSRDGVFMFDGAASQPIGADKVNDFLLTDFDEAKRNLVWSAQDLRRNIVLWAYPTSSAEETADRILVYNWKTGNFTFAELAISAFAGIETPGYSLEELDAFGDLDALPFSLDDPSLKGGNQYLAAVDANHKVSSFTGTPLAAHLVTADIQFPGGNRAFVRGARLYGDAAGMQGRFLYRDTLNGEVTTRSYRDIADDYMIHDRRNARFIRLDVTAPAGVDWDHLQGYDLDARAGGRR